ncbi:50S ribosomal protein L21 [Salinisphaera sp. USBA-960]|nr:50S ribosomal protein L21 [Salifodinibacter halophilus]NNC25635.1 50S ribosomal protein L21 [Salifodinibacter halophilus]
MYAVIATGGKQYRVGEGDTLRVEKMDAAPGASVDLSEVLLISGENGTVVGQPTLEGKSVTAEVVAQERARKIDVIKFKRRKKYLRKYGHRQPYTELRITDIPSA